MTAEPRAKIRMPFDLYFVIKIVMLPLVRSSVLYNRDTLNLISALGSGHEQSLGGQNSMSFREIGEELHRDILHLVDRESQSQSNPACTGIPIP